MKINSQLLSVFFYSGNTDEDVSVDDRTFFLIKGDDVCKGIVIEVFNVDVVQVFIAAEDVIEVTYRMIVMMGN